VCLTHYFIRAGFSYADTAAALVHRPLISEELQWVVEDFCSVDCKVQGFVWSFVKAVGLQDTAQFEHKIPMNPPTADACRVLLNNESFIFLAHCAFSFCIFASGRAKIIVADVLMYYNIPERIWISQGSWPGIEPVES